MEMKGVGMGKRLSWGIVSVNPNPLLRLDDPCASHNPSPAPAHRL